MLHFESLGFYLVNNLIELRLHRLELLVFGDNHGYSFIIKRHNSAVKLDMHLVSLKFKVLKRCINSGDGFKLREIVSAHIS